MHNQGRGGAYTRVRLPVVLVFAERHDTADSARRRERQIKRWSMAKKESLITGDAVALKQLAISHKSPRFGFALPWGCSDRMQTALGLWDAARLGPRRRWARAFIGLRCGRS